MSRAEHLQWAKDRALEYVQQGDLVNACASFLSDLRKHPEIQPQIIYQIYGIELATGGLDTARGVTNFINGTN